MLTAGGLRGSGDASAGAEGGLEIDGGGIDPSLAQAGVEPADRGLCLSVLPEQPFAACFQLADGLPEPRDQATVSRVGRGQPGSGAVERSAG
ncbi:hypothetical protein IU444_28895 [Nocardia farcinica]|uniref:hypothetical protein n=1 Tax=Nocardia farcinica TaxID=37329 RepID=UPI00189454EA|nr:hypothetical protein [Nocardia farcinica]MBF6388149.1 hypothetical protein [Nocardia farcinica]UEX26351.1 hypothetical protein LMJ57_31270 [Nocardia farcinica]